MAKWLVTNLDDPWSIYTHYIDAVQVALFLSIYPVYLLMMQ